MVGRFFEVSGVSPNEGAKLAYVWCRPQGGGDYVLVGSGYVVGTEGTFPPGIKPGQFTVAIRLPDDSAAETIAVTDDVGGGDLVPKVAILEFPAPSGLREATAAARMGFVVSPELPVAPSGRRDPPTLNS